MGHWERPPAPELLGEVGVVGEAVLEPDVELGQVTSRHQLTRLEVGSHRLVVLILHGEAVTVGEPGGAEHDVLLGRLLQIPPGGVLSASAVVITT